MPWDIAPTKQHFVEVLVVVALLAGCGATNKPEPAPASVQVSVYREPSPSDSVFPMAFGIDGKLLARLDPGDEYRVRLPAGSHSFRYVLGLYDCTEAVVLRAGERYHYRLARGCVIERLEDQVSAEPAGPG